MKITVGKKSIIARTIRIVLSSFISFLISYGYIIFIDYLSKKYETGLLDLANDLTTSSYESFVIVLGAIIIPISLFVLLWQIFALFVGVHYFKLNETIISNKDISQSTYSFPYSKNIDTVVVSDISSIAINQTSIERLFGCGSIIIEGYSNSNYSKTDFSVFIIGVDNVLRVKDAISNNFKNNN